MSILHGASGINDNTIVYIVNALNGEVKQANTLAQHAGAQAADNAEAIEDIQYEIGNIHTDYALAVDLTEAKAQITATSSQVADLVTQNGDIVGQLAGKVDTSTFTQTAQSITEEFESINGADGDLTKMKTWIQADISGLQLGSSENSIRMVITSSEIAIYDGNDKVTFWSNVQQQTPKEFIVPTGGSFQMGNFRWVPRSSGNLSLVKV